MLYKMSLINALRVLRYIFHSIYFNFHYLPFSQAIKLPVLFYKPHFHELSGEFIIECSSIRTGLVKLGFPRSFMYPNSGVVFENGGGKIIVRGNLDIGNASVISIGKSGVLDIYNGVHATASFKVACYHRITISEDALFGWDCLLMDTDLHAVSYVDNNKDVVGKSKGYAPISIGRNTWIGNGCLLLKGVTISDYSIVSARTIMKRDDVYPPYSLIAGNPPQVVKKNIFRDKNNDIINYEPE